MRVLAGAVSRVRYATRKVGYFWGPRVMSELRKRWILFRHPHATIRFGRHSYLGPGFSLHVPWDAEFVVGTGVEFRRGFRAELAPGAAIRIGSHTRFTYDVLIQCGDLIEIGEHCMFGQATAIFDGNHRFRDLELPMLDQGYDLRPLRIADHATTTTKCTITAGIGRRAVIGANSVVSDDIPPYCLAVGAPARVIDYFGPRGEEPPGWSETASATEEGAAESQASRKRGASS